MRGSRPALGWVQFRVNPPAPALSHAGAGLETISEALRFAAADGPARRHAAPGGMRPRGRPVPGHGARAAVPEHEERVSELRHAELAAAPGLGVPVVAPVGVPALAAPGPDEPLAEPLAGWERGVLQAPAEAAAHEGLAGQARVDWEHGSGRPRCPVREQCHESRAAGPRSGARRRVERHLAEMRPAGRWRGGLRPWQEAAGPAAAARPAEVPPAQARPAAAPSVGGFPAPMRHGRRRPESPAARLHGPPAAAAPAGRRGRNVLPASREWPGQVLPHAGRHRPDAPAAP